MDSPISCKLDQTSRGSTPVESLFDSSDHSLPPVSSLPESPNHAPGRLVLVEMPEGRCELIPSELIARSKGSLIALNDGSDESLPPQRGNPRACLHYTTSGTCRRGVRCYFLHVDPEPGQPRPKPNPALLGTTRNKEAKKKVSQAAVTATPTSHPPAPMPPIPLPPGLPQMFVNAPQFTQFTQPMGPVCYVPLVVLPQTWSMPPMLHTGMFMR